MKKILSENKNEYIKWKTIIMERKQKHSCNYIMITGSARIYISIQTKETFFSSNII